MSSDIGIVGLATMGRNLALNFLDHNQCVSVWNLESELTATFEAEHAQAQLFCASSLTELVASLAKPRRILLMIQAGDPVDQVLNQLKVLLNKDDIIIDGGNTHFHDTQRRQSSLQAAGIHFVGMGVSGGEAGARHGPSLMFGGSKSAWKNLEDQLSAIAAKSDLGSCAEYIGPDGAGHFVKMIHNGIEYGDMQVIAESYDILSRGLKLTANEISEIFRDWNEGPLQSYLIEISAAVLAKQDSITDKPLVDLVLDSAEQKGTGRWAAQTALDLGIPIPTIAAAIDARSISSRKTEREAAAKKLPGVSNTNIPITSETIGNALLAAKLCAYTQGMQLIRAGSERYNWNINLADPVKVWTGGCIIRARLLREIINALSEAPDVNNLLISPSITDMISQAIPGLREVLQAATRSGIPIPAFSASLSWYDAIRSPRLPQNLTQSQRDAFGAHTYKRIDDPETAVHTEWLK